MRTFIALEIPGEFANQTAAMTRVLGERISGRIIPRDSYHITLAFLGDTTPEQVELTMTALDRACVGIPPIRLHACEIGKFGKPHDATLWMGLNNDDALMELASHVRDELRRASIDFDGKSFKPHLTIMRRAKIPRGDLPPIPFPEDVIATRVTLFKSTLEQSGAVYDALYSVELGC